jgi:hypothetical protein
MGPPIFNLVNIPWALCLLFLVGVGPLIAWRKATAENFRRNFLIPGLVGLWSLVLFVVLEGRAAIDAFVGIFRSLFTAKFGGVFDALKTFYPPLCFALAGFVFATVVLEFWERRVRHHPYKGLEALGRLVWRNKGVGRLRRSSANRRVHRVAASSLLGKRRIKAPKEHDQDRRLRDAYRRLRASDRRLRGGGLQVTIWQDGRRRASKAEQRCTGMLYPSFREAFLRTKACAAAVPRTAASRGIHVDGPSSQARPEIKTRRREVTSQGFSPAPAARRGLLHHAARSGPCGQALRIFVNPMVNFLWFGGFVLVFGAGLCAFPTRERKSLQLRAGRRSRSA